MRSILSVALVWGLLGLGGPLGAQDPEPLPPTAFPPSPLAVPTPELPEWSPQLSFHAGGGFLSHALNPHGGPSPSFLFGLGYVLDEWVRLDLEVMTARISGTLSCPVLELVCTPSDEPTRLVTLLYGLRVETPTDRLRGFAGLHRGLELDGRYGVFEILAGGKLYVTGRLAVRAEARHRWDNRFLLREPVRGTAMLVGVDVRGVAR